MAGRPSIEVPPGTLNRILTQAGLKSELPHEMPCRSRAWPSKLRSLRARSTRLHCSWINAQSLPRHTDGIAHLASGPDIFLTDLRAPPTMKLLAVFTTVASREQAQSIATPLVERKLVACAQISEIESVYSWKGAVQYEREFQLLLKTTPNKYQAVESAIRELHAYELPAIFAIEVEHSYEPYAAWVLEGSSGS